MGWIGATLHFVGSLQTKHFLKQALTLALIVASALLLWRSLLRLSGTETPTVVVLSESMEPGFKRGDILFLHMNKDPIRVGEIVVYKVDGDDIPIVHRVIEVHERREVAEVDILTKGDNNMEDDRYLYADNQVWLQQHHIVGRVIGYLPCAGWVTIITKEKPVLKYMIIGTLALLILITND